MEIPWSRSTGIYTFGELGKLVRIQESSQLPMELALPALAFAVPVLSLVAPILPAVKGVLRHVTGWGRAQETLAGR